MITIYSVHIVHVAGECLIFLTGIAVLNGLLQILPRPWRKDLCD